jgi:colanic acid biosynthesis protein WcaH
MLDSKIFECIIQYTPLISIDIIVKKGDKFLLGKRVNKPAEDFFFTVGGRIYKNETIKDATFRIAKEELGIKLENELRFIGVFEHFYSDGIYDNIDTHYVNLGYLLEIDKLKDLPKIQHSEYIYFAKEEILSSDKVHKYVKDYFKRI